eukprot:TRINITY_DN37471_c0_g1_i1.p1 TRINITY_DN37471_c0_g1~~TRINITY_DN37471_c0_g1_i1.p1  ORF type:complete len:177 (+),score=24.15 TRINITY_DN37471_c0_g1_i1:87-617(+)
MDRLYRRDLSPSPMELGSRLRSSTSAILPSREGTPSWRLPESHRISPAPPKRNNVNPETMSSALRERKDVNILPKTTTVLTKNRLLHDLPTAQQSIQPTPFGSPAVEGLLRDILTEMKGMRQSLDTCLNQNKALQSRTDYLEDVVKKYQTSYGQLPCTPGITDCRTPPPPSPSPSS